MVFFNSDSKKESKSFWLFKGRSKTTRLKPSKSLRNLSSKSDNSSALSSEGSTDLSRQSSIDKAADTHVSVSRQVSDCSYMSSGSFMSSGSSSVAQTSCSTPGLCSDDRFKSYLKKSHIRRRSSLEFACSSSSLVENKNNLLRTSSVSQQYGNKYLARYSPSNRSSLTVFTSQQQGKNRQTKGDGGSDKKWPRSGLARQLNRNNNEIQSDNETCGSVGCQSESPPAGDLRVANWSSSFEKLLEDSAALHTFAEFLKKEYSHENIYFWTACERYRLALSDGATHAAKVWSEWSGRHAAASAIYDTHLGPNAPEPVNVDSGARTAAKEGLSSPTQDLFAPAQKQIFNLMKFDSYSRFLKSSVYQECLDRENRGEPLQFSETRDLDPNLRIGPLSNDVRTTAKPATACSTNIANLHDKSNTVNTNVDVGTSNASSNQNLQTKGAQGKSDRSLGTVVKGEPKEGGDPATVKLRSQKGRQNKKDCAEDIKLLNRVSADKRPFDLNDPKGFKTYLDETLDRPLSRTVSFRNSVGVSGITEREGVSSPKGKYDALGLSIVDEVTSERLQASNKVVTKRVPATKASSSLGNVSTSTVRQGQSPGGGTPHGIKKLFSSRKEPGTSPVDDRWKYLKREKSVPSLPSHHNSNNEKRKMSVCPYLLAQQRETSGDTKKKKTYDLGSPPTHLNELSNKPRIVGRQGV